MAKKNSECLAKNLEDVLGQFGSDRLKALGGLREIQIASQALFQHEAIRLNQKLGEEHPRVKQMETRLEQNSSIISELEVELEVAKIRVPEVEENDALVHGRVTDENRRGLTGLTVTAENEAGETVRSFGTAETDNSGYYALQVERDKVAKLSEVEGVYLVIATKTGEVVHRESEPLDLVEGDRVVVGVTLRREDLVPVRRERRPVEKKPSGEKDLGMWVGRGRVTHKSGQGLEGLLVRLFDKDRRYDDKLGATLTDRNGGFTITYRVQDFREGEEPGPDLYLTVTDKEGRTLYTSETAVRFDAGRVEIFNVVIAEEADGDREVK